MPSKWQMPGDGVVSASLVHQSVVCAVSEPLRQNGVWRSSKPSSILQLTSRGLSDALRWVSRDAQGITESLKGAVNKVTSSVKVRHIALRRLIFIWIS